MTDITKPENLADLLRDKLKTEFVKLIPDEKWNSLIEEERDFHNRTY